jgi:dihydrodipicolinate synthase/N-acetylneuraminate lyase
MMLTVARFRSPRRTHMSKPLGGVLAVLQVPFDDGFDVDRGALAAEIEWVYEQGADGLVVGMVSEVLRLSAEERERLSQWVCEASEGRGAIVVSVGAESDVVAQRHAKAAAEHGAQAIMAIPPITSRPGVDELFHYYDGLARSAGLPVVVQDASAYVGSPSSMALYRALWAEWGGRMMFKPESAPVGPTVSGLRDMSHGEAKVFEGSGGLHLIDTYRRGVAGTMPSADLCWAVKAMWGALEAGDDARAYIIAGQVALVVALQTSLDAYVATEKHLLVRQGVIPSARMRGPVDFLVDEETASELDRLLENVRAAVAGDTALRSRT